MEIIQVLFVICLAITLPPQMLNAEENPARATTNPPFNPLEDLILIHDKKNVLKSEHLARVKRQYDPYYGRRYPDYYPVPIILPIGGLGGFGGGFGGFGGGFGRGFGGRGFGGRGFGVRGFGGRGFGGRGFGGGFGGRGFGGGFGGGRGRG